MSIELHVHQLIPQCGGMHADSKVRLYQDFLTTRKVKELQGVMRGHTFLMFHLMFLVLWQLRL